MYLILSLFGGFLVLLVNILGPSTYDPVKIIISSLYSFSVIMVSLVQMRIIYDGSAEKYLYLQIMPALVISFGCLINQYLLETDFRLIILASILTQVLLAAYFIRRFNNSITFPIKNQIFNLLKGVKYVPYSLMSAVPIAVSVFITQDYAMKGVLAILISANQLIIKVPRMVLQYTLGNNLENYNYWPILILNVFFNLGVFIFGVLLIPSLYGLDRSLIFLPFSIIIISSIFLQRIARFDANLIKINKITPLIIIKFLSILFSGLLYLVYYNYISELVSACTFILVIRFFNYLLCLYYENYK
jgi:hypothetical protein